MTLKIFSEDCSIELADDRTLPYTAYLVTYKIDEELKYDVVMTDKKCDIFDHYWDKYREDFLSYQQTEGRANPRLWGNKPTKPKK